MNRRLWCYILVLICSILVVMPAAEASDGYASTQANQGLPPVLVITAPPFNDTSAIVKVLTDQGYRMGENLELVRLGSGWRQACEEIDRSARRLVGVGQGRRLHVVSLGPAVLPLRCWLEEDQEARGPAARAVFVAPPQHGSFAVGMLRLQGVVAQQERYREKRGMYRTLGEPVWSRPAYRSFADYLCRRTMNLFERLYHYYLLDHQLSLVPSQFRLTRDFVTWMGDNYPARTDEWMLDCRRPIGESAGNVPPFDDEGAMFTYGYLDLLAATCARHTYFRLVSLRQAITEDIMSDVVVLPDWRATLAEFARRRLQRFAGNYVMPRLLSMGRQRALDWCASWLEADPENSLLALALPSKVKVEWKTGTGPGYREVTANAWLESWNRRHAQLRERNGVPYTTITVSAPNWWCLPYPGIGRNDWWTEVDSMKLPLRPGDQCIHVSLLKGGNPGGDDRVASAVWRAISSPEQARSIDFRQGAPIESSAVEPPQIGGGDPPSGDAIGGEAPVTGAEIQTGARSDTGDTPCIEAVYQCKHTTLKRPRRIYHDHWEWDFGDGCRRADEDRSHIRGRMSHQFNSPGRYEVTARSLSNDGRVLQDLSWWVDAAEAGEVRHFDYETVPEVVPHITISGPDKWVVGKPARYTVSVEVNWPAGVADASVHYYPARRFDVLWERPGRFTVTAAVNLRFSYRLGDRSVRFSTIFTESIPVEVLATSLQ